MTISSVIEPADTTEDPAPDLVVRGGGLLLLGWALLAPLTIPLPGPGGVRLAISDILGLATLAILPLVLMSRGRFIRVAPLAALLGWMLLTTLLNLGAYPSAVEAMFRVMRGAFIFSPMALALLIGDELDATQRSRLLNAYLAASLGGMMAGLIANAIGWSIAEAQTYDFGRGQVARATGLMGDSSAYGHLGASAMALVLCLLAIERRPKSIRLALCCFAIAILPAFFYASLSRAFLVDLLVVVFAMIGLACLGGYDRAQVLGRIFSAVAVMVVAIGILAAAFPLQARTVLVRLDLDSLTEAGGDPSAMIDRLGSGRSSVWSDTMALAQANPAFGLGYKGLMTRYGIPGDNVFLSSFADLGVMGGMLMIGLILLVAVLVFAALFRAGRRDIIAAIAAPMWIGQMAHMLLLDVTSYYSSFPLVLTIMALAITADRRTDAPATTNWRYVPGQRPDAA